MSADEEKSALEGDPDEWWLNIARQRLTGLLSLNARTQHANVILDVRQRLDRELTAIESMKAMINAHRNTMTGIDKLPPEVLAHCFDFVVDIDPPGNYSEDLPTTMTRRQRILGWIKVSHVCKRWRTIALKESILWRNITFVMGITWAQAMLTRARSIPVDIFCSFLPTWSSRDENQVRDIIRAHLHHVHQLDLHAPLSTLMLLMNSVLFMPVPVLTDLRFRTTTLFEDDINSSVNTTSVPSVLVNGVAPNLRTLGLMFLPLPPPRTMYSQLTRLELVRCNPMVSSHAVLAFLAAVPSLQHLHSLRSLVYVDMPFPITGCLPHLHVLMLHEPSDCCLHMTQHLRTSVIRQITWSFSDFRIQDDMAPALTEAHIASFMPLERSSRSLRFDMACHHDNTFNQTWLYLEIVESSHLWICDTSGRPGRLLRPIGHPEDGTMVSLRLPLALPPVESLTLDSIVNPLHTPKVEQLIMDLGLSIFTAGDDALARLLHAIPQVRHLVFASVVHALNHTGFGIILGQGSPPDGDLGTNVQNLFLPTLVTLTLIDSGNHQQKCIDDFQESLLSALQTRRNNHPDKILQRLVLGYNLAYDDEYVEELRKQVATVDILHGT